VTPGRLRRLARLPGRRRRLLVEAAAALCAARVAVSLLPFRLVAKVLGHEDAIPGAAPARAAQAIRAAGDRAELVGWAVTTAAAHVPWPATCLVQALAAALMLAARRVPTLTVLGVDRDGRALRAHA
jgi:transglutaminase superfamily protein